MRKVINWIKSLYKKHITDYLDELYMGWNEWFNDETDNAKGKRK